MTPISVDRTLRVMLLTPIGVVRSERVHSKSKIIQKDMHDEKNID